GVVRPDHTVRTKTWPLIVAPPEAGKAGEFQLAIEAAVKSFVENYQAYFARNNLRCNHDKRMLDPMPRVVLVPGLGLFGLGRSKKDARIAADLAQSAVATITDAEAIGRFEPIGEAEMFDVEYWSLEQAKLGKEPEQPLAGQVALVTGAAGAIGDATARALAGAGAEIALLDLDEVRVMLAQGTGGALLFNVSKQAVNPGVDFGPYGLPKAATLLLARQYALEYGKHGIRANAVNADRIRSGLLTPELIAARAAARGLSEREYMAGNLLGRQVTAEDVARAFLYHATALKTTADVTTVDGGN